VFAPPVKTPRNSHYLVPPPGYRFRPPWYARPEFYVPVTVAAFIFGGLAIYISMNVADLKNQAAAFDLNKLQQMESASVILDRNGKIFGQIYVENRETIPYEQIPRNLVNAAVAVEDSRFTNTMATRFREFCAPL
jgi:membrane peptidoglycan carboxypeptidase